MIHILSRYFSIRFVNLACFGQAAHPLLIVLPINVAQPQHIVYHNEVLVEFVSLLRSQAEGEVQGSLIAFYGVVGLVNVVVDISQYALNYKLVIVLGFIESLQDLNGGILVDVWRLFRSWQTGKLHTNFYSILKGGFKPESVFV